MEEDTAKYLTNVIEYMKLEAADYTKLVERNKTNPRGIADGLKEIMQCRLHLWRHGDPCVEENMARQRCILSLQFKAYHAIKDHLIPSDKGGRGVEVRKCKLAIAKLIRFSTDHYTSILRTIFRSYTVEDGIGGLFGRNPILDQLLLRTKDEDVKERLNLGKARNSKLVEFVASLLLRLGDVDRYHSRLQEEHKHCDKFYAACLILDPSQGVAWNGLAASYSHHEIRDIPKFELIYAFYRAATAVKPFPAAIENCRQWLTSVARSGGDDGLDMFYVMHSRIWNEVPLPDGWDGLCEGMLTQLHEGNRSDLPRVCLANIAAYVISRAGRGDPDSAKAARNHSISNLFLALCLRTAEHVMRKLYFACLAKRPSYVLSSSVRFCYSWFVLNVDTIMADVNQCNSARFKSQLALFFRGACDFASFVLVSNSLPYLEIPEYLLDCDLDVLGFAPMDRPDNAHLYREGKLKPYQHVPYNMADEFELHKISIHREQYWFHFHGFARDTLALVQSETAPVELKENKTEGGMEFVSTYGTRVKPSGQAHNMTVGTIREKKVIEPTVAPPVAPVPPVSNQQWVPPSSPPQPQEALPSFDIPSSQPEEPQRPQEAPKTTPQQETTTFGAIGSSTVAMLEGQIGDARPSEQRSGESQRVDTQNTQQRFFSTGVSQDVAAGDSLLAGIDDRMQED